MFFYDVIEELFFNVHYNFFLNLNAWLNVGLDVCAHILRVHFFVIW